MSIAFKVFGYTVASIDVDLGALPDVPAVAPVTNRVVRDVSGWWTRKAFERG